jgi:hypothetical protein
MKARSRWTCWALERQLEFLHASPADVDLQPFHDTVVGARELVATFGLTGPALELLARLEHALIEREAMRARAERVRSAR